MGGGGGPFDPLLGRSTYPSSYDYENFEATYRA